jgi:2,4-dienoyl-CoA reductase-like NADH-dependent reductase (Old Yellow Enzyme family)
MTMPHQSLLFSATDLRDVRVPNRVVVAPMCQYSARDGLAGEQSSQ